MKLFFKGYLIFWVFTTLSTKMLEAQSKESKNRNPFEVSVAYTGDLFSNISGGLGTGARYFDNIDVNLEIDFGKLPLGLDGTTFYVYGLGNQGGSISELTGDLQGVSNIEANNSWRFFEIWAQKKFFLANSSILVGLYDINSEFNVLNSSLLFINSSHGLDPTLGGSGVLGPSTFPFTSIGTRLKINPVGGWVLQAAVLDGVPSNPANPTGTKVFWRQDDGLILLAEVALHSTSTGDLQQRNRTARLQQFLDRGTGDANKYKFALGGWIYTKEREGWQNVGEHDMGVYGLGEFKLYREPGNRYEGLTIFGRAGLANEAINRLNAYLGGGITYTGLLPGRDNDRAGLAVAHAISSSAFKEQSVTFTSTFETSFEFTYLTHFTEQVQLQGDIQYVVNPSMNSRLPNALAAGIRLLLSF